MTAVFSIPGSAHASPAVSGGSPNDFPFKRSQIVTAFCRTVFNEARTDLAMCFGLLFLLITGAGTRWSLDAKFATAVTNSNATG